MFKPAPSPMSLTPPTGLGGAGGVVHFNQAARQQPMQQQQMIQYVQIPGNQPIIIKAN